MANILLSASEDAAVLGPLDICMTNRNCNVPEMFIPVFTSVTLTLSTRHLKSLPLMVCYGQKPRGLPKADIGRRFKGRALFANWPEPWSLRPVVLDG